MSGSSRALRAAIAGLALVALVAGCTGADRVADTPAPLPTPVASPSGALATAARRVTQALDAAGFRVTTPMSRYRPSEPASLTRVDRSVLQVVLADPDLGYVVIYDLATGAEASARATELAAYLGSGFGQTNFPIDAQFSVAQLDSTVIMTWWSRERSSDPDQAQGAFDVVRTIGQPYPVVK